MARVRAPLSVLAGVLAVALLVVAARPAAAQGVTPADLPLTPDPADCAAEPLTAEELLAIYADATPAAGGPEAAFEEFLAADPADEAAAAAVTQAAADVLACANSGNFLSVLALTTEAAAVTFFGPEPGTTAEELEEQLAEFAEQEPEPLAEEERISLQAVLDVRELGSGRLGALMISTDPSVAPTPTLDIIFFAERDGAWLLDGFVEDPYGLTPGYPEGEAAEGTPTP